MSKCTVQDEGAGKVVHFGAHVGGGVFFHRADGVVTICQHPHADAQIPATFVVAVPEAEFVKAAKAAGTVPETREERETREAAEKEAEAEAQAEAQRKADAKAAKAAESGKGGE